MKVKTAELYHAGMRVLREEGVGSFVRKAWAFLGIDPILVRKGLWRLRGSCTDQFSVLQIPLHMNARSAAVVEAMESQGVRVAVQDWGSAYEWLPLLRAIGVHGKPHVIHIHWAHPFLTGWGALGRYIKPRSLLWELGLARRKGIKVVWTVHNLVSHESQDPEWELGINRRIAQSCDEIIVHTELIAAEVMRQYRLARDVHIVPPAHFVGCVEDGMSKGEARRRLGLRESEFAFGYFGKIRPYKGVDILLDAFDRVNGANAKLIVAGQAKYLTRDMEADIVRRCSSGRVISALRWIDDCDVQMYVNAADVMVSPFRKILNTASVVCAMSLRKPVIAPAMGGIPDLVDDGGGFLYDPADRNGLLAAMKKAMTCDRATLESMGQRNYARIKGLTPDMVAAKTVEIYRGIR